MYSNIVSSFRTNTVRATKLQANCCSLAPLALLRGVEEQSVLTGEATKKIGHTVKTWEKPQRTCVGLGKQGPSCTGSTLKSALKNVIKLPCNVNRWHRFAVISLHLNSNVPSCSFSAPCAIHFLRVLLQDGISTVTR